MSKTRARNQRGLDYAESVAKRDVEQGATDSTHPPDSTSHLHSRFFRHSNTRTRSMSPAGRKRPKNEAPSSSANAIVHDVEADLRVVADKADSGASPEDIKEEFELLLHDCERFLQRAVLDDYDAMRKHLVDVIVAKDGRKNVEQERRLLSQEADGVVLVSLASGGGTWGAVLTVFLVENDDEACA